MDNDQLLKIILERFDSTDKQFANIDKQFKEMANNTDTQFKEVLNSIDAQFKEVLSRLDNIERSQQDDVKGTLKLISKKVDGIIYDIEYLSEKTGRHDIKINNLEKRIQS